ncbi:alpha-1B adrenergic receptor-like [Ciona intestinalis]
MNGTVENGIEVLLTETHDPSFAVKMSISVAVGFFLVFGSAGSFCTIVVILSNKSLHTIANFFILSLCVSDLTSALVCSPLWLYRRTWGYNRWQWGEFLCKFYWVSDLATNYVTSMHILSFAALRFIAVRRPFQISAISKRVTLMYITSLWLLALVLALPLGFFMGVQYDRATHSVGDSWPSCSMLNDNKGGCCVSNYSVYFSIINPLMFYVPEVIIIILSATIIFTLLKKRRWRRRFIARKKNTSVFVSKPIPSMEDTSVDVGAVGNVIQTAVAPVTHRFRGIFIRQSSVPNSVTQMEKSTFVQLTLIVVSFMIGYIPFTVYCVWASTTPEEAKGQSTDYWFGAVSYLCLRFSECLNPIVYLLGSSALRDATKQLFQRFKCTKN